MPERPIPAGIEHEFTVEEERQVDSLPLFQDRLKKEWGNVPEMEQKLIELKQYLEAITGHFESFLKGLPKLTNEQDIVVDTPLNPEELKAEYAKLQKRQNKENPYRKFYHTANELRSLFEAETKNMVDPVAQSEKLESLFKKCSRFIKEFAPLIPKIAQAQKYDAQLTGKYKLLKLKELGISETDEDLNARVRDTLERIRAIERSSKILSLKKRSQIKKLTEELHSLYSLQKILHFSSNTSLSNITNTVTELLAKISYNISGKVVEHIEDTSKSSGEGNVEVRTDILPQTIASQLEAEYKDKYISPAIREEAATWAEPSHGFLNIEKEYQEYLETGRYPYHLQKRSPIPILHSRAAGLPANQHFHALASLVKQGDVRGRLVQIGVDEVQELENLPHDLQKDEYVAFSSYLSNEGLGLDKTDKALVAFLDIGRVKVFLSSPEVQKVFSQQELENFRSNVTRIIGQRLLGAAVYHDPENKLGERLLNYPNTTVVQRLINFILNHSGNYTSDDEVAALAFELASSQEETSRLAGILALKSLKWNIEGNIDALVKCVSFPLNSLERGILLQQMTNEPGYEGNKQRILPALVDNVFCDLSAHEKHNISFSYRISSDIVALAADDPEFAKKLCASKNTLPVVYKAMSQYPSLFYEHLVKEGMQKTSFIAGYAQYFRTTKNLSSKDVENFQTNFVDLANAGQKWGKVDRGAVYAQLMSSNVLLKVCEEAEFKNEVDKLTGSISPRDGFEYEVLKCLLEDVLPKQHRAEHFGEIRDSFIKYIEFVRKHEAQAVFSNSNGFILDALTKNPVAVEKLNDLPEHAPLLLQKENQDLLNQVLLATQYVIKDSSDWAFFNTLISRYEKKAFKIGEDYTRCIKENAVTTEQKKVVMEFLEKFRVLSPALIQGYLKAKESRTEEVFIAGLNSMAEKMTGKAQLTDTERKSAYYKDLIAVIYPNNSGTWTSYENNESCADRSADLTHLKIKPRYEIDLLSAGKVSVKEGQKLDESAIEAVKGTILSLADYYKSLDYDPEQIKQKLAEKVDQRLKQISENGGLLGFDIQNAATLDEKLFLLMADSVYSGKGMSDNEIKSLIINYEFAFFEDVRDYIAGTTDRVSQANNKEYALLCELNTFFSDRIKEVNRKLVQSGWSNSRIAGLMPKYFEEVAKQMTEAQQNRLQIGKLGLQESFIKQIRRVLQGKTGKQYTSEQIEKIIRRYEAMTGGLKEKLTKEQTKGKKARTVAFYGQLKSQRDKTIQAVEGLTGQEVDVSKIHLGELNLQQLLEQQNKFQSGNYNEEEFGSYTVQRFLNIFGQEQNVVEKELDKFQSESGHRREVLYGYITKSKESAHARQVGGVCVCGDNPQKGGSKNLWDLPNYYQMVLQDPESFRSQGLVLMHEHKEPGGKKILSLSPNPSSTYLYSVDEAALCRGLVGQLTDFARENNFDQICFSKNKTIRTNRTGGVFEAEMDKMVSAKSKEYTFAKPRVFSYHPEYNLQAMDVIWEKS